MSPVHRPRPTRPTADDGGEDAFLYARLDQKTFNLSFRLEYSLIPDLTIQYYGSPFVSAGTYRDFKRVTAPRAERYEHRFDRLDGVIRYDEAEDAYLVDENGDGRQYTPDSRISVVWSQARSDFTPDGTFDFRDDMNSLFDVHPNNVFLVKIVHWLNL